MHCQTSASEEHGHCPPVSPWHEKFRLTPLFKPFLMKSTQKWNWLMPNEYHWIAVIVRLMFVTLKLFIKHQFHFKSGHAMKCALTPLRILWGFPRALSALKLNNRKTEGFDAITGTLPFFNTSLHCLDKMKISTNYQVTAVSASVLFNR